MQTRLKFAGIALTVALLAGCAAGGGTQGGSAGAVAPQFSGFLADYSKLKPVDGVDGTLRYIDTSLNLRPYTKVMIDPVQIFTNPNPEYKGLQPDALKRMSDAFQSAFLGALVGGYQVVNKPGPDVMRVRLAITGILPTRPDLGATDFIPIKALFNVARSAAGEAPQVAEISAEIEVLDPNGKVIGAAVSTRKGDKTVAQGEKITWKDLQAIVDVWAKNMRQHLDQARGYAAK
ncbi:MAG: DUF3313 domain-containing protein [Rhodocyclaceae bacterium]